MADVTFSAAALVAAHARNIREAESPQPTAPEKPAQATAQAATKEFKQYPLAGTKLK